LSTPQCSFTGKSNITHGTQFRRVRRYIMKSLAGGIYLLIIITAFSGCDLLDISGGSQKNFTYPVQEGNVWEYERKFRVYNFRTFEDPDSVIESQETFFTGHSFVQSNGMVSLDEFATVDGAVFELEATYTEEFDSPQLKSRYYYTYKNDGLYMVGYHSEGGAIVMPKFTFDDTDSKQEILIYFDGKYFSSVREVSDYVEFMIYANYDEPGDIIVENPHLKVIPRYMSTGTQWTYRTKRNPWRIDKRILGKEMVDVPAGQFECYKVQWFIDLNDTGEWDENLIYYDYISDEGLVKREFYFKDQIWYSIMGSQRGYFDSHDISVLIDAVIK